MYLLEALKPKSMTPTIGVECFPYQTDNKFYLANEHCSPQNYIAF